MSNQSSVSPAPAAFSRVMIAVGPVPEPAPELRYLRSLLHPGVAVLVVCIAENPRTLVPLGKWAGQQLEAARDELRSDAANAIQNARHALDGCGAQIDGQLIELRTHGGDLVHALAETASQWQADLVVLVTRHHHGLWRWVEGEVSTPLARLLHWPALIVPANYEAGDGDLRERILFATDGSDASVAALRSALGFATPNTHWRIISVVDRLLAQGAGSFESDLEDSFAQTGRAALNAAAGILAAQQQPGWTVETALVTTRNSHDDVAHAIVREARRWQAQLLVLGAHGRRGLSRWLLGSVAERTVRLTPVPLLLAPATIGSQRHAAPVRA